MGLLGIAAALILIGLLILLCYLNAKAIMTGSWRKIKRSEHLFFGIWHTLIGGGVIFRYFSDYETLFLTEFIASLIFGVVFLSIGGVRFYQTYKCKA